MNLLADFRYASRSLRRRPGLTSAVVLTAALAIGACTALFDLANLIAWMPIPGTDTERLVRVYTRHYQPVVGLYGGSPTLDHAHYVEHATSFDAIVGERWASLRLEPTVTNLEPGVSETAPFSAATVETRFVSGDFFQTLGVGASKGRLIEPGDDRPAAEAVAVASERFFRTHLAGDESLLGEAILLNGQGATLVGVADAGFEVLVAGNRTDLWLADAVGPRMIPEWLDNPLLPSTDTLATLKPGVSIAQAREELRALAAELDRIHPIQELERELTVVPARLTHGIDQRNFRPILRMLGVAVVLLLLLSCANIANLLLGRSLERLQETAIRQALGAGFARLVRLMLAESILLSLMAGIVGLGVAFLARNLFALWDLQDFAALLRFDHRVLLLSLGTCVLSALAFGTLPAVLAARTRFYGGLRQRTTSRNTQRAFSSLTVLQLALATVLVVCSAAIAVNLLALRDIDLGFDDEGLVRAQFFLGDYGYTNASGTEFLVELEERLQGFPGLIDSARALWMPPVFLEIQRTFTKAGEDETRASRQNVVAGSYFQTLDIPLLFGRTFRPADAEGEPVVVVNQMLAEQTWPDLEPSEVIGRTLVMTRRREADPAPEHRVIGVVGTITQHDLRSGGEPILYLPLAQRPRSSSSLLARIDGDPAGFIQEIRAQTTELDANVAPLGISTFAQLRWDALVAHRLQTQSALVLATIGLALSLLGVFGVMQMMVARRRREMGVRIAMGADQRRILSFVLGRTARLALCGVAIGIAVSVWAASSLGAWVSDLQQPPPWVFFAAASLLLAAALGAALMPARRATRIEPTEVLRAD